MSSSARHNDARPTRERARRAVQRSARELEAEGVARALLLAVVLSIALATVVGIGLAALIFAPTETEPR